MKNKEHKVRATEILQICCTGWEGAEPLHPSQIRTACMFMIYCILFFFIIIKTIAFKIFNIKYFITPQDY